MKPILLLLGAVCLLILTFLLGIATESGMLFDFLPYMEKKGNVLILKTRIVIDCPEGDQYTPGGVKIENVSPDVTFPKGTKLIIN